MKDILGYEGIYAIDECGQVWSYRRKRFLNPFMSNTGYPQVSLYLNGSKKTCFVHRLVAETFLPNPDNKPQVHHVDGDRTNPTLSNLQWTTPEENSNDDIHKARCGSVNTRKVYCVELDKTFDSQTIAAKEIGVSPSRISECCRGITKTSGGYHWQFVE